MPHVVLVDGSLRPGEGNSARALHLAASAWPSAVTTDRLVLATLTAPVEEVATRLARADAFLFGTGTYWGSWGSPLQRFLEVMTPYEATDVFLGKPAAAVVTMNSTGGSEVAARLVATLSLFGCVIPSFGWMTLSRVGVTLAERDAGATRDVWGPADLRVLADNLLAAAALPRVARAWDIERSLPVAGPWPSSGPLPPAAPDFLE